MDWFRLYHRMIWDSKVRLLTDAEFRLWIGLLCLASQNKRRGYVERDTRSPYGAMELQNLLGIEAFKRADLFDPSERVAQALQRLASLRLVRLKTANDHRDPTIIVTNWLRLQYERPSDRPEKTRARKRKQRAGSRLVGVTPMSRASHENVTRDASVSRTGTTSLGTSTDTETDTDADAERPPRSAPPRGLTPSGLVACWNRHAVPPFAKVKDVTGKRLVAARRRLAERTEAEWWDAVIVRLMQTPFLRGAGKNGWVATFDWLIRNDTNAVRVLEGVYDDHQEPVRKQRAWFNDPAVVDVPAVVRQVTEALPRMPS